MKTAISFLALIALIAVAAPSVFAAGESRLPAPTDGAGPCTRFTAGSVASNPTDLFSKKGVLTVSLSYNTETDANGRTLYCFTTPDGTESPTLHVHPGDHLVVNVTNNLPATVDASALRMTTSASDVCGASSMGPDSVNIHFHGTNTSPVCHQDDVIHTLINSGDTFRYDLKFPEGRTVGIVLVPSARSRNRERGGARRSFRRDRGRGLGESAAGGGGVGAANFCHSGSARGRRAAAGRSEQRALMGRDAELRSDSLSRLHAGDRQYQAGRKAALAGCQRVR